MEKDNLIVSQILKIMADKLNIVSFNDVEFATKYFSKKHYFQFIWKFHISTEKIVKIYDNQNALKLNVEYCNDVLTSIDESYNISQKSDLNTVTYIISKFEYK